MASIGLGRESTWSNLSSQLCYEVGGGGGGGIWDLKIYWGFSRPIRGAPLVSQTGHSNVS